MLKFKDKVVLLTGSTGGIGRVTLDSFIKNGAKVLAVCRNKNKLSELSELYGDNIFPIECDLLNDDDIANLRKVAYNEVENVDILVCNAGVVSDNLSSRMKREDWDNVIRVNLTSTFLLNQIFLKKMMTRRYGRVINISSVVAFTGNAGQANYVAAKAGIIGMSKSLSLEYASRNITVNVVAPGFIETEMTAKIPENMRDTIREKIPNKRFGMPSDVANAILFLASDDAAYINGTTIHVNGGLYMT